MRKPKVPVDGKTKRIGVLDETGRLTGDDVVSLNAEGPLDPGDLPMDRTYKWDASAGHYMPVGYGFPKPKGQPFWSLEMVVARLIETHPEPPAEALAWKAWYDENLRAREVEKHG